MIERERTIVRAIMTPIMPRAHDMTQFMAKAEITSRACASDNGEAKLLKRIRHRVHDERLATVLKGLHEEHNYVGGKRVPQSVDLVQYPVSWIAKTVLVRG